MMADPLSRLPTWIAQAAWSTVAILFVYLASRFLARRVGRRLSLWASKTRWQWDELVVEALQRGIPTWGFLLGLSLALGFWPLPGSLLLVCHRTLSVAAWLSVTFIAAGLAGRLIMLYGDQFQHAMPVTSLTQNVTKILIVILGVLMILHSLGIPIAPLLTALGVGGLAVALALQDTLSNLFAGFYLTVARQVRLGDYVKLESGQEGYIEDIGWRATKIRMLPNNMVLVPNKKLGEAIITNYDLPSQDLAVTVEIGVAYASDLDQVERVTSEVGREVMQTVTGGVPTFEPFIRFHSFGDSSVNFTVILRAKQFVDQYLVTHEFIKRLLPRYRKEGIAIPFPTQTVIAKSDEG